MPSVRAASPRFGQVPQTSGPRSPPTPPAVTSPCKYLPQATRPRHGPASRAHPASDQQTTGSSATCCRLLDAIAVQSRRHVSITGREKPLRTSPGVGRVLVGRGSIAAYSLRLRGLTGSRARITGSEARARARLRTFGLDDWTRYTGRGAALRPGCRSLEDKAGYAIRSHRARLQEHQAAKALPGEGQGKSTSSQGPARTRRPGADRVQALQVQASRSNTHQAAKALPGGRPRPRAPAATQGPVCSCKTWTGAGVGRRERVSMRAWGPLRRFLSWRVNRWRTWRRAAGNQNRGGTSTAKS